MYIEIENFQVSSRGIIQLIQMLGHNWLVEVLYFARQTVTFHNLESLVFVVLVLP